MDATIFRLLCMTLDWYQNDGSFQATIALFSHAGHKLSVQCANINVVCYYACYSNPLIFFCPCIGILVCSLPSCCFDMNGVRICQPFSDSAGELRFDDIGVALYAIITK